MRKSRFTEVQIVQVLHEWDAGAKVADLIRRLGVTEQTLYRWKKKYGGMLGTEANQAAGLAVATRKRKRVAVWRVPLSKPERANERWSMDFVSDALGDGRKFRALTIGEDYTRESPAIIVDRSLTGDRVAQAFTILARIRGRPKEIVCDYGPEFRRETLDQRADTHRVTLQFIQSGNPV